MADRRGISGRSLGRLGNPLGAPAFVLWYNSTSTAGTSVTEVIQQEAPFSYRVIDAWVVLNEAGGDAESVQLQKKPLGTDTAVAITDDKDISSGGDTDYYNLAEIDDAYHTVNKGDRLQILKTEDSAVSKLMVYVLCVRV